MVIHTLAFDKILNMRMFPSYCKACKRLAHDMKNCKLGQDPNGVNSGNGTGRS